MSLYHSSVEFSNPNANFYSNSSCVFYSILMYASCSFSSSSQNNFVAIVDLPEGEHQYKFYVDGQWTHDPSEVTNTTHPYPY